MEPRIHDCLAVSFYMGVGGEGGGGEGRVGRLLTLN